MDSINEEQILKRRPSEYQQTVLSIMGINQWHIRGIRSADESIDSDINERCETQQTQQTQQEKKAVSISALRDALSTEPVPNTAQHATSDSPSSTQSSVIGAKVVALSPGLHLGFDVEEQSKQFVDDVVSSMKESANNGVKWQLGEALQLTDNELTTPSISSLIADPGLKRQLWTLLLNNI